jgi:hypothetical protein
MHAARSHGMAHDGHTHPMTSAIAPMTHHVALTGPRGASFGVALLLALALLLLL